jgi:hypothetical protein
MGSEMLILPLASIPDASSLYQVQVQLYDVDSYQPNFLDLGSFD